MDKREKLLEELVKLFEESKYNYQLKNYLKSKGVNPEDMNELIREAKKIYISKSGKKRKIIWAICAISTFILFYFLIPNSIYNISPMIISFIGGGVLTFFITQAIADFRSWEEFNTKDKLEQDWRHKYTPLLVIPGLILVFVFVMRFSSNEKSELKEFGIKAKGVIVDGTSMKTRRGGTYQVSIKFKTKEGKSIYVNESVGESEFNSLYKGQKVDLIYSSKDPQMIELLTSEYSVKEYTESLEKRLEFNNLTELLDIEHSNTGAYLNKIRYGWEYVAKDSVWVNERSNSALKIIPQSEISYINSSTIFLELPKKLKEEGYIEIENDDKGVKILVSDDYAVLTKMLLDGSKVQSLVKVSKK